MAGASSTPIYRNTSTSKIRSRSNTETGSGSGSGSGSGAGTGTGAGVSQGQLDADARLLRQKSASPVSNQLRVVSPSASGEPVSSSSSLSSSSSSSNGHSKKSSLSLQPKKSQNHRRSQSFLAQLSSHVRSYSNDAQAKEPSGNGNNAGPGNIDSPSMKLSVPNSGNSINGSSMLAKDFSPIKGKMSPENSPLTSSMASPVKVSGVAAGPNTQDLILEISDDVDIDRLLHNEDLLKNIPRLSGESKAKSGETLSIRTVLDDNGNSNNNNSGNSSSSFFRKLNAHYPNLRITVFSILLWYAFSMGISVYNRWMFSSENLDFRYPIIITSFHQLILTLLAMCTLILFPSFRLSTVKYQKVPNKGPDFEEPDGDDNQLENGTLSYTMPIKEYLTKILPCSLASAGDIGLGNAAFRFITLSLYTMVKTSALIFVLLWGVFFKLERLTVRIFTIVCVMTFGVSMMIWGQHDNPAKSAASTVDTATDNASGDSFAQFSKGNQYQLVKRLSYQIRETGELKGSHIIFIGVSLVLLSACMSGLRWALTQIMLKKNKRTKNPILTMLYISPGMCCVLFLVGTVVEGVSNFLNAEIWEAKGVGMTIVLILIPGLLAFFMTLSEYVLLQYASLLTLSIAGIFKELLTIFVSWVVFGDELTFINIIGLTITFADIVWYNVYRFQQNAELAKNGSSQPQKLDNEFVDIELNSINMNSNRY